MITVYKYPLPLRDEFVLGLPRNAQLLHAATQDGAPCLWALVVTTEPTVMRKFRLAGTGHPVESGLHVSTFFDGPFVWHLFDQGEVP